MPYIIPKLDLGQINTILFKTDLMSQRLFTAEMDKSYFLETYSNNDVDLIIVPLDNYDPYMWLNGTNMKESIQLKAGRYLILASKDDLSSGSCNLRIT